MMQLIHFDEIRETWLHGQKSNPNLSSAYYYYLEPIHGKYWSINYFGETFIVGNEVQAELTSARDAYIAEHLKWACLV